MNTDAYAALPDDLRAVLDETVPEAVDHYLATYAKVYDKWWPELEKRNIQQIEYTADDLAAFKPPRPASRSGISGSPNSPQTACRLRNCWISFCPTFSKPLQKQSTGT
jgi:hypothetical protein